MFGERGTTVRVVVKRFGKLDSTLLRETLSLIKACYSHLDPHDVKIVDLYLFQRSSTMNAFLNSEKKRIGVASSPYDSSFIATHDAWHGTPRIMISFERLLTLPRLIRIGSINHETAHTVLHGSPEYYIFPVPHGLITMSIAPRQSVLDILYLISIAVKDYEVTRLLIRSDYIENQIAYCRHLLEPSEDDVLAWRLAELNKTARLLVLTSILKTACCIYPLTKDERRGGRILKEIVLSMRYLPKNVSKKMFKVLKTTDDFDESTHSNVERFTDEIALELRDL